MGGVLGSRSRDEPILTNSLRVLHRVISKGIFQIAGAVKTTGAAILCPALPRQPRSHYYFYFKYGIPNPTEHGILPILFRLLKGTTDHHCFRTAAVGPVPDDADAGCGRAAGSFRRRAQSRHR